MTMMEGPYTLLKSSDLDRIRNTLQEAPQTSNVLDKVTLHAASIERSKKWPNTIHALRAKKEAAKREKAELEEAERCKVDAEEAAFRAEQRRMQEREAQIAYKQTVKQLRTKADQALLDQQRAALAKAEDEEKKKAEERKKKLLEQKTIQGSQLDELRTRILKERADVREEGARLRARAEADAAEARRKEEERRQQAVAANLATAAANDALKKWKEDMRERERQEERQNAEYVLQKQQQLAERRAAEDARTAKKAAHRARLIAARERALQDYKDKNEARLKEQEEARIQAEDNREREAAERRAREAEAIDKSRKQQLWNKHKQREAEFREQKEFVDQWKRRNAEIKAEEAKTKQDALAKARAMQAALKKQMVGLSPFFPFCVTGRLDRHKKKGDYLAKCYEDKKARRREQERMQDLEEFDATMAALSEDEATFREYADVCVNEWATLGKSTKPMTLMLSKKREELMAATVDL
ncbi:hypothetical protein KFL_000050540 [Klebsormidium nitens]|uniref:Trichohyalin-plectin-homology domain-containing protein n=1 Tax=Klebsormidium nitens TaxID=105231 RepID=A0A1Y1HQ07_KLENI|nr:hypothetical protein KFL_000050540 [Klebsormidium nitens]|eukprot:GAQ77918.1 hypothetical protein KFL_000050540 [Klebsormidium nitens]